MLRDAAILIGVVSALVLAPRGASAEFHLERHLALEPNGTFTLDSDAGSVTLTGDSASGVVVTVTSPDDALSSRLDIQFTGGAGNATVTARRTGRGWADGVFGNAFRGNVHFEIHVPRSAVIDLRTGGGSIHASGVSGPARVHTSGGSITVADVVRDLDASTSGGSVDVQHVQGRADVHTSGGSIDVRDVRGDLRAGTSGGSIEVRDAGGRVEAHTAGGHVSVAFNRGNNRGGDLSTSGGGVRAAIDPGVALSIDAATSGGSVVSDVPVTVRGSVSRRALHGELNGGGAPLRIHSSGGSIRIDAAAPSSASR